MNAAFDDSVQLQLQGGAFNMSATSGSMAWPQNAGARTMPGAQAAGRPPSLNALVANPTGLLGAGGQAAAAQIAAAQQQQQLQQQIQQLQAGAGGGSQVFTLTNGTRVVKAGQPYPNTTIVQTMPTGTQQMGMVNVQRPPVMMGQGQINMAQPVNPNALGLPGLQNQAAKQLAFMQHQQQQQMPQQHVLVAQPQQGLQQVQAAKLQAGMGMPGGVSFGGVGGVNVGGVNGMAVRPGAVFQPGGVAMRQGPMGASSVRPLNIVSNAITLQQVFAPPPANITTTITSVRPAMRIPKLGTVATYNPVTGVRSATTNGVTPGVAGAAGVPALPAGLPASLVQQMSLLQQQGGLLQGQLQQQQQQPSGAMAVRPGTLINGGVNGTGGSQRQTTVVVGSNGITAMQQQQQQTQQQQGQQQVVNITLADGTTTTTVLDQATLARMLSETSRGQAAKIQFAATQQQQQQQAAAAQQQMQMRQMAAAAANQQQQQQQFLQLQQSLNGGLQQVQLSGAPSQLLIRTGAQQQQQQFGVGRGLMQDGSPTAAQMLGGMQVLSGSGGFLQAATSQQQHAGGNGNGAYINIFDGSSAALAQQLQAGGASQQQLIDGLSVVDLNAIVDQQNSAQSNSQNAPQLRGVGTLGTMSNVGSGPQQLQHPQQQQQPDMSGSSFGHMTHDDTGSNHNNTNGSGSASGGATDGGQESCGAGMNGGGAGGLGGLGLGLGMGMPGSSREDLKMILVSIGQELARHGISVETAVTSGWLGVLSPMDVAVLADAYAEEERRVAPGQPTAQQQQQQQLQMQLQLQLQMQGQPQQQMHSGSQSQLHNQHLQHLHGSSGGADSGGSAQRALSGLSVGSGLGAFGPAGTATGSAVGGGATNGSNSNTNSDTPLGEFPGLGLGGGNTTCSADRSATAAILALTSSSARTSMSVAPSEDGNGGNGGNGAAGGLGGSVDGPPSAPTAPLPAGTGLGLGGGGGSASAGFFDRDGAAAAAMPDGASGAGNSFGAFQYGLFGMGGLVQPGSSLSAEHDRPVDRSDDAAALAEVFGEKPWAPAGFGLMAEELGLNAQQHPQQMSGPGPKLIDSASEYEARRQAAAASAAAAAAAAAAGVGAQPRAASSDCHVALGGAASGIGALVPLAALAASKANLSAPVAAVAVVAPENAAGAETDKEMAKRFANLDLGCGFY